MKTTNTRRLLLMGIGCLLLMTMGCKKGEVGPQGPEGNANVFSKTFSPSNITWTSLTEYGTNYKVADLSIPEITSDIVTNGSVLVYSELIFSGQTWTPLPVSYLELGITKFVSYGVKTGSVRLRYSLSNNTVPPNPGIEFRVVYMSAKELVAAKQNNVDLSSYQQVGAFIQKQGN